MSAIDWTMWPGAWRDDLNSPFRADPLRIALDGGRQR